MNGSEALNFVHSLPKSSALAKAFHQRFSKNLIGSGNDLQKALDRITDTLQAFLEQDVQHMSDFARLRQAGILGTDAVAQRSFAKVAKAEHKKAVAFAKKHFGYLPKGYEFPYNEAAMQKFLRYIYRPDKPEKVYRLTKAKHSSAEIANTYLHLMRHPDADPAAAMAAVRGGQRLTTFPG